MKGIFFYFVISLAILGACDTNQPASSNGINYQLSILCDTCGNDLPVTPMDSSYGMWPPLALAWATKYVSYSPDRSKIAGYCLFKKEGSHYQQQGVFVYDLVSGKAMRFVEGRNFPYWSPDGKYVSMSAGASIEIYNLAAGTKIHLPTPTSAVPRGWSMDSKAIYAFSYNPNDQWPDGIYRVAIDGSSFELVVSDLGGAYVFEFDQNNIVYTYNKGFVIYDRKNNIRTYYELEIFNSFQSGLLKGDLSPDRKKIVCEAVLKAGNEPGTMGLFVVNLEDKTVTKVMENARYRPEFYPRWSTNSEILCSLFCRNELSYTTWEIDLQGKLIRKVTDMTMQFY